MQTELQQATLQTAGEIIDEDMDEPGPGQSSVVDYMQLYVGQIFFQQRKSFQIFLFPFWDSFKIRARTKFICLKCKLPVKCLVVSEHSH